MDTDQLRTFVAVVRRGGFTAAARELGYVQSTVTGHVQSLERRLGVRLLDRLPGGAEPTDAGRRLLPLADQLLDVQARMLTEVPALERPTGTVRLIAPESLCAYRLPAAVAAVRAAEPAVRVALVPAATPAALTDVRGGACDIALLLEPELRACDVVIEPIGAEEVRVFAAPGHLPPTRAWADLAAHDAVLLEEGCRYADDTVRALEAAGQPAERRTRFGSIEAVKHCVAAGLGWTVLPVAATTHELARADLVMIDRPRPALHHVYAVTNPARTPTAAAVVLLSHVRELFTPRP
ncbi:LysR family transcriptional regulator [Pseudonocardia sp. TRM90224]|uniref:LysR family transcriptional regulator n=1 Tax=Pseudonocardia sp. TRM90224 TaxID=2812678 RepID=UPI001E3F0919|nr:LysR family transcriptional regulator [Pseudonocardia sp. TRM90224]